jgi:redox-sensitive bicupin YhaK (pirin superfamily)
MSPPAYQELDASSIPVVKAQGARVKVLSGRFLDREGPVRDPLTSLLYLDVSLPAGSRFELPLGEEMTGFLYPFEGEIVVAGLPLRAHELGVLGPGDRVEAAAANTPARLVLVAGRPLKEPVVQHGPFVMNTREQIDEALRDYRDGRLVKGPAAGLSP